MKLVAQPGDVPVRADGHLQVNSSDGMFLQVCSSAR
jgi:hypothetical protein